MKIAPYENTYLWKFLHYEIPLVSENSHKKENYPQKITPKEIFIHESSRTPSLLPLPPP